VNWFNKNQLANRKMSGRCKCTIQNTEKTVDINLV
jgi:hypothetical protein